MSGNHHHAPTESRYNGAYVPLDYRVAGAGTA